MDSGIGPFSGPSKSEGKKRKRSPPVETRRKIHKEKRNCVRPNITQCSSLQNVTERSTYNTVGASTENNKTLASEDDSVVIIGGIERNNSNSYSTSQNKSTASTPYNAVEATSSYNTIEATTSNYNSSANKVDSVVVIGEICKKNSSSSIKNDGSYIRLDNSADEIPSDTIEKNLATTSKAVNNYISLLNHSNVVKTPNPPLSRIKDIERDNSDLFNTSYKYATASTPYNDVGSRESSHNIPISNNKEFPRPANGLRPIIIDGSNVARTHGSRNSTFSIRGIKISVDHFVERGHKVVVYLPHFRRFKIKGPIPTTQPELLDSLMRSGNLIYTPPNTYDDRYIIQHAALSGGVILTNDKYRDLLNESELFRQTITQSYLRFGFAENQLKIPMGKIKPRLKKFLRFR